MKWQTIFENDQFIAINKPAGLLSIPAREGKDVSLKQLLQERFQSIYTVHRLDKETSGIIVFAKDEATHKKLSEIFEGRSVEKYYVGLVQGKPMNEKGTVDIAIAEHPGKKTKMITHSKGKPSVTDYEVLETFRTFSWMQFRIHTGRTHQIRVHMQHIGHPIVCDELYGNGEPVLVSSIKRNYKLSKEVLEEKPILHRLALHSHKLVFQLDNEHFELEAEIPKDLRATLQQLRKHS